VSDSIVKVRGKQNRAGNTQHKALKGRKHLIHMFILLQVTWRAGRRVHGVKLVCDILPWPGQCVVDKFLLPDFVMLLFAASIKGHTKINNYKSSSRNSASEENMLSFRGMPTRLMACLHASIS
jgi:hypothetical protein